MARITPARLRKVSTTSSGDTAPASNWGNRGVPKKLREQVLRRDGYRCQLRYDGCIGEATEADHIVNVASLGVARAQAVQPVGLQAVCVPCHRVKTQAERTAGIARHYAQRHRTDEPHPGLL